MKSTESKECLEFNRAQKKYCRYRTLKRIEIVALHFAPSKLEIQLGKLYSRTPDSIYQWPMNCDLANTNGDDDVKKTTTRDPMRA